MILFSLAGKRKNENPMTLLSNLAIHLTTVSTALGLFCFFSKHVLADHKRENSLTEPVSLFVCSTGLLLCVIQIYYLHSVTSK